MSDVSQPTRLLTQTIQAQIEMKRAGRRKHVNHGGTLCSACLDAPPDDGDHYCAPCRAAYMRNWHKKRRLEYHELKAANGLR